MLETTLSYICRGRQRAVQSVQEQYEQWQRDHADAMAAADLEDWLDVVLRCHENAMQVHHKVARLLRSNAQEVLPAVPLALHLLS
jgi:hypothetical protein